MGADDVIMRRERRTGDRRGAQERRRGRLPVGEDRRLVRDRRRGARREGLAARLLRYVG